MAASSGFNYTQEADIPAFLRWLADQLEQSEQPTEFAAIVYGTIDETVWVQGVGQNGTLETIGVLRMGEQILMNTLMTPINATTE